jgi:predicted metal-dependent peptidase
VVPAVIERGALRAGTSGGTSLECVLEHVAQTRPACAVIVTDGYVEAIAKRRVAVLGHTRMHAIVTRDGNPALLKAAGIPHSQLGRLPK